MDFRFYTAMKNIISKEAISTSNENIVRQRSCDLGTRPTRRDAIKASDTAESKASVICLRQHSTACAVVDKVTPVTAYGKLIFHISVFSLPRRAFSNFPHAVLLRNMRLFGAKIHLTPVVVRLARGLCREAVTLLSKARHSNALVFRSENVSSFSSDGKSELVCYGIYHSKNGILQIGLWLDSFACARYKYGAQRTISSVMVLLRVYSPNATYFIITNTKHKYHWMRRTKNHIIISLSKRTLTNPEKESQSNR